MKIAVVGCGAVGSYYGAKLGHSGQEMHFLLRSDYEAVKRRGVFIQSPEGDFNYRPHCARQPEEIGASDLVLIALKTTANDQLARLVTPLVGPQTAVLTLQNGLGNEELLANSFGIENTMGGLCFVCLNRLEPGVIRHFVHGTIVVGEFKRWPEPRTHDIASMIRNAGVPSKVADNLEGAHWEKLVWNIPFNGLGVASAAGHDAVVAGIWRAGAALRPCLTTDKLLGDPPWHKLVRELMLEVIAAANARGLKLENSLADMHIERTSRMGAYRPSTVLDFENGLPLEVESLFLEPLRQARATGVSTPRLAGLCQVLAALNDESSRKPARAAADAQGNTTAR